jgi:hypothetical protein
MPLLKPPFEYCAMRFLIQWERKERRLHAGMKGRNRSNDAVRESLRYFQVARNFKELHENDNLDLIRLAVSRVARRRISSSEKVETLANIFKQNFHKFNLAAASKLLWLVYRRPYVVYDSRVVVALQALRYQFDTRCYSEYCKAWRTEYDKKEAAIKRAAKRMPQIRAFFPPVHASHRKLHALARQPWFLERVFDIYLWEIGGKE